MRGVKRTEAAEKKAPRKSGSARSKVGSTAGPSRITVEGFLTNRTPTPPRHLTEAAKIWFTEVANDLKQRGRLESTDAAALGLAADSYADLVTVSEALAKLKPGPENVDQWLKLLALKSRLRNALLAHLRAMGLTAIDRGKVRGTAGVPGEGKDPFGEFAGR